MDIGLPVSSLFPAGAIGHLPAIPDGMTGRGIALLTLASVAFAQPAARKISFNGRLLTPEQQQRLTAVESFYGVRIPDRDYWYDNLSGAVGIWKGPTAAFLPAGLGLGGPMPA